MKRFMSWSNRRRRPAAHTADYEESHADLHTPDTPRNPTTPKTLNAQHTFKPLTLQDSGPKPKITALTNIFKSS